MADDIENTKIQNDNTGTQNNVKGSQYNAGGHSYVADNIHITYVGSVPQAEIPSMSSTSETNHEGAPNSASEIPYSQPTDKPKYSQKQLFKAMKDRLSATDIRALYFYLSYDQRLSELKEKRLSGNLHDDIADLIYICDRTGTIGLLTTTLNIEFPRLLKHVPTTEDEDVINAPVFWGRREVTIEEAKMVCDIGDIVKRFGDWVVTDKGLEWLLQPYCIEVSELGRQWTDPSIPGGRGTWVTHMASKLIVNIDDFVAAFIFAQEYHFVQK